MKSNWKRIGLLCSLVLELFFWMMYLSLLLTKIGSPLADILWLASGALGIIFGAINCRDCQEKLWLALSFVAIAVGVIQLPLWAIAMFITSM